MVDADDRPETRWLFTHPSWLRWWTLPNLERHADQRSLVTGVICVFVESASGNDSVKWAREVRARTERLGLQFAYGMRHSHQAFDDLQAPMSPQWQRRAVTTLRQTAAANVMLDMEPYYSGARRYHTNDEAPGLYAAARVWRELGDNNLFVYPLGPHYHHSLAVALQARRGGSHVHALDASTYNPYRLPDVREHFFLRHQYFEAHRIEYVPGFYLNVLRDREVMREAERYGQCWFFPRTRPEHPDDLPRFGTPRWNPTPLEGKMRELDANP